MRIPGEVDAEQVLAALGTLIEARDPYTAGHQARVAQIAVALAYELGLSPERIDGLRIAALVHDVGKIVVPSSLLMKPTTLSEAERELMCLHVLAGVSVLDRIDFPWPVSRMVHEHHERLDGTGYPRGLAGDAVLFESRILAVADTFEALTSFRPYRAAMSTEAALALLERDYDRAFDGRVVDACVAIHREAYVYCAPAHA